MARKIDATPRALTRENRTASVVFHFQPPGSLANAIAHRVQVTLLAGVVIESRPIPGVYVPLASIPAAMKTQLESAAAETLFDNLEANPPAQAPP